MMGVEDNGDLQADIGLDAQPSEQALNLEAAADGFRHLARNAEDERIRFRACEALVFGLVPPMILGYREGRVNPRDLRSGAAVPVYGLPSEEMSVHTLGADIG